MNFFLVYTGLAVAALGILSMLRPLRFLGIRTRPTGAGVLLCGMALSALGATWPAPVVVPADSGRARTGEQAGDSGTAPHDRRIEVSFPDSAPITWSEEQLRKHRSVVSLVVPDAPAYPGSTLKFDAIPLKALVPQEYSRAGLNIVFECLDGFAAAIPSTRVLGGSPGGPQAFLAIEDPAAPWPPLKERPDTTAGPFYLVWKADGPRQTAPEEWPYQIARIVVKQNEFHAIAPDASVGPDSPVEAGFQIYLRNCSACHTLNGIGDSNLGPDLNAPMNPTEYFKDGVFEKYVRNPDAILYWKDQRMPSFPAEVMTDAELAALRAYLEYMAPRKSPPPSGK
jgi:mono/diheme cytochrome c family protein